MMRLRSRSRLTIGDFVAQLNPEVNELMKAAREMMMKLGADVAEDVRNEYPNIQGYEGCKKRCNQTGEQIYQSENVKVHLQDKRYGADLELLVCEDLILDGSG